MSVANSVPFNNFCDLCAKISEAPQDKKIDLIQNYIECWKKRALDLEKTQPGLNCSFYPVMRFLLPHLDRERGAYGIKEHTLAKIYIRILSLPKEGKDAAKFLGYRTPKSSVSGVGDFAEVAYWILKRRCTDGKQLSIGEVNKHLDAIAEKHASNEPPRAVEAELISLLKATSALEQKWLIRILLKDMKLGVGQNGILKGYHADAKDLYDASNNLQKVCEILKDRGVRLHEVEIELFSPLRPMLSEECNLQKIDGYLKKSRYFFVETKLDGERFQLHKNEGDYKYFSRNGYDYTINFGATRFEGILTPKIANQFFPDVRSCILDGEMMAWNPKTGTFASKGKNIDVKSLKEVNAHQPCFCIFDVLFYNGQVLTNQPLKCRLEILNKIINPLNGVICFPSRKRVSAKEEIIDCLNEAIDNREEGIVMKEFMSVYKPNVRKNGGWYKIKPEYVDGLSDTLDLLILGGYYGSGRHQGRISHFLLGVAVSVEENSKLFYSVGRVGSGYTMTELEELQSKLQPHWNKTKAEETPLGIEWTKEKPDVWIAPEKSFILEVKAAEIVSSVFFKTGYTLRFPRVEKVRYEKSWKNCLTLEEFEEKRKLASGKLASFHLTQDEYQDVPKKKSPRSNKTISLKHKILDVGSIERVCDLLKGKEICVFTGFDKIGKTDVERRIIEYGGTLVQNPGKNTFCILAESNSTVHIKNVLQSGLYDFVKTSWFYSQLNLENKFLSELKPHNFLAMSTRTSELFAKYYDEYGDHFTIPATKDSILQLSLMASNKHFENIKFSLDDKYDLDVELFSGPSPYSLFRLCRAYFDHFPILQDPSSGLLSHLQIVALSFRFYGGHYYDRIGNETTHVVIFSEDFSRVEELKRINRARKEKFHIVTEKWIQSSITNNSLSKEDGF